MWSSLLIAVSRRIVVVPSDSDFESVLSNSQSAGLFISFRVVHVPSSKLYTEPIHQVTGPRCTNGFGRGCWATRKVTVEEFIRIYKAFTTNLQYAYAFIFTLIACIESVQRIRGSSHISRAGVSLLSTGDFDSLQIYSLGVVFCDSTLRNKWFSNTSSVYGMLLCWKLLLVFFRVLLVFFSIYRIFKKSWFSIARKMPIF